MMQSAEFAQLVERAVLVERLLQGAPRLNLRAPQALRARTLAPLRSLASVWVFLLFGEFLPTIVLLARPSSRIDSLFNLGRSRVIIRVIS